MDIKPPEYNDLLAYLLQLCKGDDDTATLLAYFITVAIELARGKVVKPDPPLKGARFYAADKNLANLGLSKFNAELNQHEIQVSVIYSDFIRWYRASLDQFTQ